MSGNLFENRNWLLPQNYLASENKNENVTGIISPRPPTKEEELKTNEQSLEKMQMGTRLPLLYKPREGKGRRQNSATAEGISPVKITKATGKTTQDPELE